MEHGSPHIPHILGGVEVRSAQHAAAGGGCDNNSGVAAESTCSDGDLVDILVQQLEAQSDDEEEERDTHEGGSTTATKWVLRYATYMTGVHHFVQEKHRVQSYLAEELARAERELDGADVPKRRTTHEQNDV